MNPRKIFDVQESEGRVPPQAVDTEEALLGGILIDYLSGLPAAIEFLQPGDFYKAAHQNIYKTMLSLFESGEAVDLLTIITELKKRGDIEKVGGEAALTELTNRATTSANVGYHARYIFEQSLKRKMIGVGTEMVAGAFEPASDTFELLQDAEEKIFALSEFRVKKNAQPLSATLGATMDILEKIHGHKTGITGIESGFKALDHYTAGFQNNHLIVVAGRPSQGKTALVLSIARNAAALNGTRVGLFSMEMSTDELVGRLIGAEARVNSHELRRGKLSGEEFKHVAEIAPRLSKLPIFIDDTPYQSAMDIRAKARRLKHENGIQMVIVDYMQLMKPDKEARSREEEISKISRSMKALAKELCIPVIALSQLNRMVELRQDKRPVLADLRESGAIEQDADEVIFVHRPEMYKIEGALPGVAEIIIAKQRNGPTGELKLSFVKEYARFENYSQLTEMKNDVKAERDPF